MFTYSYTRSPVFIDTLHNSLTDYGFVSATYEYLAFNEPSDLKIFFTEELSSQEKTDLDTIVATHDGTPVYEDSNITLVSNGTGGVRFEPVDASSIANLDSYVGQAVEAEAEERYIVWVDDPNTVSTTSTGWRQALIASTAEPIPAGDYLVLWYYEWQYKHGSFFFNGRVMIDDSDVVMDQHEQPTNIDGWQPRSGFKRITLASGTHNIEMSYCSSKSGKQAKIRNRRLELWRT